MTQNIIVTDDGTEISDSAPELVCEIAKPCEVSITLLHVIERIEDPETMIFGKNREISEKAKLVNLRPSTIKNAWQKQAQRKIQKLREQNIKSNIRCLSGDIAEKILEHGLNEKVDMIVMGSSSRLRGISKIKALGSVTHKVFELVTYPVVIVQSLLLN